MDAKSQEHNVVCMGAGYVGVLTMTVMAFHNPNSNFTLCDINLKLIQKWALGEQAFTEPNFDIMFKKVNGVNLFFTTEQEKPLREGNVIFICVNTPPKQIAKVKKSGEIEPKTIVHDLNLSFLLKCGEAIAETYDPDRSKSKIIVIKSTIPLLGEQKLIQSMKKVITGKVLENKENYREGVVDEESWKEGNIEFEDNFYICSSPEFLAEGTAIQNLLYPDRLVIGVPKAPSRDKGYKGQIGCIEQESIAILKNLHNWVDSSAILVTNIHSSELGKLASNAMLGQRISSINSLTPLCEQSDASINEVRAIVAADKRIGDKFLNPSFAFGGSCFLKDIACLSYMYTKLDMPELANYWKSVIEVNNYQKKRLSQKIIQLIPDIKHQIVTVFGLSFKPDTSDTRETPSCYLIDFLLSKGAYVNIHDPLVTFNSFLIEMEIQGYRIDENIGNLNFMENYIESCKNSKAIIIATDWKIFKEYDYAKLFGIMSNAAHIFDFRNILDRNRIISLGFKTFTIGH